MPSNPNYANNSQYSLEQILLRRPSIVRSAARALGPVPRVVYIFEGLIMWGTFIHPTNFNIWDDYGRSDDDQLHRFVFDGTIFPWARRTAGWATQPRFSLGT
jgi:hypothetical protein